MRSKGHKTIINKFQTGAIVILLFFSVLSSLSLKAQTREVLPCLSKKFTIIAHIVLDTTGQPNVLEQDVIDAITVVNQDFSPICVSFEICEFRYIDNFQYDDLVKDDEWSELLIKYHEKNRINLFLVNSTDDGSSFATGGGIGVLDSGGVCIVKTHTPRVYSHEFGHYFGLAHTWEGSNAAGSELVNGSNCATGGDQICDTPADPFIEGTDGETYVDADCRFIDMQQDANGDYYTPDIGNIMSYYPGRCKCGFSHDQFWKMANTYLNSNPKMW